MKTAKASAGSNGRRTEARPADPRRRKAERAAALWGTLTLGATGTLSALVIWHLVRRGRLIRERLGPPRPIDVPDWADPESDAPRA